MTAIAGHTYARDRAPYDDPILREQWRRRWNCSCGDVGDWGIQSDEQAYRLWFRHATETQRRMGRAS